MAEVEEVIKNGDEDTPNVKHIVTKKHDENSCKLETIVLCFMNSKFKKIGQWRQQKI